MNSRAFSRSLAFKYLAIAILPLAAMFYTQAVNLATLAFGEPVSLETAPVDPTDILRGDYVTLGYKISDIDSGLLRENLGDDWRLSASEEIFVTLKLDKNGVGSVDSVSTSRPAGGLYLRGRFRTWSGVDYGIDRYYVPEGTGLEIE